MSGRVIPSKIISPGIANGLLFFLDLDFDRIIRGSFRPRQDIQSEISGFERGCDLMIQQLNKEIKQLKDSGLTREASILHTHLLILDDRGFHRKVGNRILTEGLSAALAIEKTLRELIVIFENSRSPLFSERSADIKDIGIRLVRQLDQESSANPLEFSSPPPASAPIIVTSELFPSLILGANAHGVRGFLIERGTIFSHAAILAKAMGIPVLRITRLSDKGLEQNQEVLLDALKGQLILNPSPDVLDNVMKSSPSRKPAEIKTSFPVRLSLNVMDPDQVQAGDIEEVEGIGLYRTEFLFIKMRDDFPAEDEQVSVYETLFKKCRKKSVVIRTLDIGGDKTLPYFSLGPQNNPALGLRAHRVYRFHPEILVTQIRAILRAGLVLDDLRILYPMIESLDELVFVQGLLDEAKSSLRKSGMKFQENFQQGIMLEVPSAVWNFEILLDYVDFASVGTNDLLQYFFAVDRNNANVYGSYNAENPVFLKLLKKIIQTSNAHGKPLILCGELAADVHFLPLLLGLGFDRLSVDIKRLPDILENLHALDPGACKTLTQKCLRALTIEEVHTRMHQFNFSVRKISKPLQNLSADSMDPVCHMEVDTQNNPLVLYTFGKHYYFCSPRCMNIFDARMRKNAAD